MADATITIEESSSQTGLIDAESVVIGASTVLRERVQVAGVSSGAIAPVSSAAGIAAISRGETNQVVAGTTAITVSRAAFGAATSGALAVVSSVANANIRVLGWNVSCASSNTLTWFSDSTAGSTLAGPYYFPANGGAVVPIDPLGWFETTAAGIDIVIKADTAANFAGNIVYIQSSAI